MTCDKLAIPTFSVQKRHSLRNLVSATTLALTAYVGIQAQTHPSDYIPRDRLVTNKELFQHLDWPRETKLAPIQTSLSRDTTVALQELAEYFKTRSSPRYFFAGDIAERMQDFKLRYEQEMKAMKVGADNFISTYGTHVDWKKPGKDRRGREHTPNTIRFLARQWQAENIALKYFLQNRNKAYKDFLMEHVRDFIKDYEAGNAESGDNDVFERFYGGHRARNWLFMHQLLLADPEYRWEDQIYMVKVFLLHGARLVDVCKKFNWGNHQLVGLVALYEVTTLFPEFTLTKEWNKIAKAVLLEHMEKEIPEDGFQFERASHYFKLDIMNYFRVYQLSGMNGVALPEFFHRRFRKMFDAIVNVAMPNRRLPVLQDAQAVYRGESNDMAELPETHEDQYMSIGATLFGDPVYKYFGSRQFPSSLYWFFEPQAAKAYEELGAERPTIGSVALPDTRYYVMRTGWSANDLYMVIDGGLAKQKPDHTHGGVLGVVAFAFNQLVLPNYHVRYSDPSYKVMKNSLVKNVALVDDLVQGREWRDNKARTGFGIWQKLPQPTVHEWLTGETIDYFSASHDGFAAEGVDYRRSILFVKPHGWLVMDDFRSNRPLLYRQLWQGEYTLNKANASATQIAGDARIDILQADGGAITVKKQSLHSTNAVIFESADKANFTFSTLLIPSSRLKATNANLTRMESKGQRKITMTFGAATATFIEHNDKAQEIPNSLSDARLLFEISDGRNIRSHCMHEGTFLKKDEFTLRTEKPATVEMVRRDGALWEARILKGDSQVLSLLWPDGSRESLKVETGRAATFSRRKQP